MNTIAFNLNKMLKLKSKFIKRANNLHFKVYFSVFYSLNELKCALMYLELNLNIIKPLFTFLSA